MSLRSLLPHTPWGDKVFHYYRFLRAFRRWPNQQLYNDMLLRLRFSPETDYSLRRQITDKEFVKDYIREKVGAEFNIPTIAVLRSLDEARAYAYPDRCVIKSTHACGHVIFRRNGEPIDMKKIERWFATDHYRRTRDRSYYGLKPKIIVEPFVFDLDPPPDYKIFCWRGEPRMILVFLGRFERPRKAYYDTKWTRLPFSVSNPQYEHDVPKPQTLDLMLDLARKLSADFPFLRVDLYSDDKHVLVGELAGFPNNGINFFIPPEGEVIASRILFGRSPIGSN